jgi:hypothetical protein
MTKSPLLITLAVCLAATPSFAVMSEADCQALWKKADTIGDGKVTDAEAKIYIEAMSHTGGWSNQIMA